MSTRAGATGAVAVLLTCLLAALLLAAPPAGAAKGRLALTVDTLTPAVATSGATLRVAGTVTNTGDQPVRDVQVRLRLSETRLNSRSELAAVMAGRISSRDGQVVLEADLPDLAAGDSTDYELSQALDDLPSLTGFGVYVLGVEVVGTRPAGAQRRTLRRTVLPWAPTPPDFQPTGYSWLWPLVDVPVRLADGTFADDSLARDLAPGGRLDRLLTSGARLDVGAALTWVVDPELLETVADMADGYDVVAPDGGPVPGGGSALAQRWLDELRTVTAGADVLPLAYADPDLVALVRHGRQGGVARARAAGADLVARLLPAAVPVADTVWPVDGYLNRASLTALRQVGVTTAVLDSRALPATIDLSYTPSGRAALRSGDEPVAALLADPVLVDLLAAVRRSADDPVLAAQRVVAETAMITSELPSTGTDRTIVVMPPRRWDPPQPFLDQLVQLADAPWSAPVSLRELAASEPPEVDRDPLRYPPAARRAELPESYQRALDVQRQRISNFAAVLTERPRLVPGLEDAVRRLESSWWRGRVERGNRLDREQTHLTVLRGSVRVQPGSFTFGSSSGNIPLTLVNELDQEVVVLLRLEPQTTRLRLGEVGPQTIGPSQKVQVNVPATSVAGGPVAVRATLHTRSGAPYGQPVTLRVQVTQIGTVAMVITVAAGVVLFVAAGIRVARRLRRAAARADEPDPDEPDPAEPERVRA